MIERHQRFCHLCICWWRNGCRTRNPKAWKFNRFSPSIYPLIVYLYPFSFRLNAYILFGTPNISAFGDVSFLQCVIVLHLHSHIGCYVSIKLNSNAKACFLFALELCRIKTAYRVLCMLFWFHHKECECHWCVRSKCARFFTILHRFFYAKSPLNQSTFLFLSQ